jgi:putative hydrolase of the HAD superfamily
VIRAALFDFGGVILSSPFEAFARYERERNLADGFLRRLNSTRPDDNAWAQLERGHVSFDAFCRLYEEEARAAGGEVDARDVMALLAGDVRPAMVEAVRRCHERLKTACLTNNWVAVDDRMSAPGERSDVAASPHGRLLADLFDVVVESSKVGVRKPDPRFYELACEQLAIEPHEAVFLDDIGGNLKPARAMGMTTIKVADPEVAIADLESVVGFPLRSPDVGAPDVSR